MKYSLAFISLALPVIVSGHLERARHVGFARAVSSSESHAASSVAPVASSHASSAAAAVPKSSKKASGNEGGATKSSALPAASGAAPASPTPNPAGGYPYTLPNPSVELLSTNPTAIALAQITPELDPLTNSQPTHALATPASPGATAFAGAPALPNAALLNPKDYPTLDQIPSTNSPEVIGWIKDVKNSGIKIPGLTATNPGGCANNSAAIADNANRCWWTCGGCVRSTDITTCPDKYTWGLTYDDGPSPYTPDLLNYLGSEGLKATFFVVGSRAISYPSILQSSFVQQHQIAVHTWSHPPLSSLTNEQIIAELGWTKKIIKDVTGVTPLYWRPPYGDLDDRVRAIATAMHLTPIMWTNNQQLLFDTEDFGIKGGLSTPGGVLTNWKEIVGNASTLNTGFIVLEHDLFEQAVDIAVGYILPDALATKPKLTIEPIITCNKQPISNAYIETNDNKSNPVATVAPAEVSSTTLSGASPTGTGHSGSVARMGTLSIAAAVGLILTSAGFALL